MERHISHVIAQQNYNVYTRKQVIISSYKILFALAGQ